MRNIEAIVNDLKEIYQESGIDAKEYLQKARKLRERFGPGLAIVYCWFYSVPQKWMQIEPKIFQLKKQTNSFDLDTVISIPSDKLASMFRSLVFPNKISFQFKNFCKAIKKEYASWDHFAKRLAQESIFRILSKLRKYKAGVTFKNLAAMKIFVGMNNNLLILDTHVSKLFGINKNELYKYRTRKKFFEALLDLSNSITGKLKKNGIHTNTACWSLSIWFNRAKVDESQLLSDQTIKHHLIT